MTPHPQAEILRAIADGEDIEAFYGEEWYGITPMTALRYIYDGSIPLRVKPKIINININGIEVPEPMREMPPEGTSVYWPGFGPDSGDTHTESADVGCYPAMLPYLLRKGLLHLTEEAAAIHAKALLSFTRRI